MCLNNVNTRNPYNDSKIRFKIILKDGSGFKSLFVRSNKWKIGEWNKSEQVDGNPVLEDINQHSASPYAHDHGFHCYVHFQKTLIQAYYDKGDYPDAVLGVFEVEDFIAGGGSTASDPDEWSLPTETWGRAKLLCVEEIPRSLKDEFYSPNRKPLCA